MCGSCRNNGAKSGITPEQAFEGVGNYCRGEYGWSAAEDNAAMMNLEMATIPGALFSVWHNISGAIVAKLYSRNA